MGETGAEREVAAGLATPGTGEDAGYYFARFPAQADSSRITYTLNLQAGDSPSAGAKVWASSDDVYAAGQAAQAGEAPGGDLVFKLYYRYTIGSFLRDIAGLIPQSGRAALAVLALFILPGLAVLAILSPRRSWALTGTPALIMAIGLSVAACPIALIFATALGARISETALWIGLAACAAIVIARAVQLRNSWRLWVRISGWEAAAWGLFLASLAVSLIAVREVRYPLWTDSLHHTVITQLIIDRGQIPDSYLPYYALQEFSYHFGFHSLAAYLAQLAQYSAAQAVILAGQLVIPITGLTIYLMVEQLTGKPSLGFFAAATVLFLNHVPALYVNWGRYTQLAAQMLLPVCVLAIVQALRAGGRFWIVAAGVLAAGAFLTHYRVAVFVIFFVLALGLVNWRAVLAAARKPWPYLGRLAAMSGVAALLSAYWLAPLVGQSLSPFLLRATGAASAAAATGPPANLLSRVAADLRSLPDIGLNALTIALSAAGAVIGLWRRQKLAMAAMIWMALLFLGAYSGRLGLSLYVAANMLIALYLPAAILSAHALDWAWNGWDSLWRRLPRPAAAQPSAGRIGRVAVVVAVLAGLAFDRMGIARPENGFVRPADERAMQWIGEHVPASARFVVASEFWQPTIVEGRDAGWWLPLLAKRDATVPLQRYIDGLPEQRAAVNQLAKALDNLSDAPKALDLLRANGVTHVYVGNRPAALNPSALAATPGYELIYRQDGVWVFEVRP